MAPDTAIPEVAGVSESDNTDGARIGKGLGDSHFGTVARRALHASDFRRGRKARKKDNKSLPSRLSKMSLADEM